MFQHAFGNLNKNCGKDGSHRNSLIDISARAHKIVAGENKDTNPKDEDVDASDVRYAIERSPSANTGKENGSQRVVLSESEPTNTKRPSPCDSCRRTFCVMPAIGKL